MLNLPPWMRGDYSGLQTISQRKDILAAEALIERLQSLGFLTTDLDDYDNSRMLQIVAKAFENRRLG